MKFRILKMDKKWESSEYYVSERGIKGLYIFGSKEEAHQFTDIMVASVVLVDLARAFPGIDFIMEIV